MSCSAGMTTGVEFLNISLQKYKSYGKETRNKNRKNDTP